ncbi:hypothetical protein LEP1GSC073_0813 [Leptospira noguchii str. Cascata]|nr:hypothetical protein LEP1GSC072_3220 [Leptospira noguchii str. Bonito]EMS89394.1 hypothetical protein LEP1GSC073_0813 [Leptospira noguchii str. Cascata]
MSHFNYEICERFAPIFLRRTHVKYSFFVIGICMIMKKEFWILIFEQRIGKIYSSFLNLKVC